MGDETWDIHVSKINDKTRIIHVAPTASVDVLYVKVAKLISANLDPDDIRLIFAAQPLEYGSGKTLPEYNIQNGSTITPLFRLPGGVWPVDALKTKKFNLKPFPGYITVTTSKDDVDMITLENDPNERRAKMPCGDIIGPASMTSYCHSLLDEGKFQFHCPKCRQEWPYFLVRHVACLTGDEMRKLEERISENYVAKANGIVTCPGCHSMCYRDDSSTKRMRCVVCVKLKNGKKDFCWICLKDWIGSSNSKCGNADCDGIDSRIKQLALCPMKSISNVVLPSIRGCPKCGSLIEHKEACKHMTCLCKYSFCFACLKPMEPGGRWGCTTYGNDCVVAPRQTSLPGC